MQGARDLPRLSFGATGVQPGRRRVPDEVAVALVFNGVTQAVMMATPADLEDFATGFALTEGIARPDQMDNLTVVPRDHGIEVQVWVDAAATALLADRRRSMTGPVGCGLCGIDSLEQAVRVPRPVAPGGLRMTAAQVMAAVAALPGAQPLHDATRAAHAAAFWQDDRLVALREDVGRHNALDKLAGHLVRARSHGPGAVVLTSRVSVDMVQKVAMMDMGVLIAVSAPTAAAVALADAVGITLIALARPDRFEVFTHSDRIAENTHVR